MLKIGSRKSVALNNAEMVSVESVGNGITPEEKHLIYQLRQRVQNELPENELVKSEEDQDLYLVKWCRARDLNLNRATDMFRNHLQWRKEMNADNALDFSVDPFFPKNFTYMYAGADKFGHPVVLGILNEWDFRKIINNNKVNKFDSFLTHFFESHLKQITNAHNSRTPCHPPVTQLTVIIDAKGYPYGQLINFAAVKKLLHMASTYEAHYPEVLFKAMFLNCPSCFGLFMNLIKTVIAPKTLGKISCYSSMSDWQKEMGSIIDPAILPPQFGGIGKPYVPQNQPR